MHQALQSYRAVTGLALALAAGAGCESPLARQASHDLRQSVIEAAQRETRAAAASSREPMPLTRTPGEVTFPPERLAELDQIGGPSAYMRVAPDVGPDLLGQPTTRFAVNLRQAVITAVGNNLDAETARLAPAIDQARLAQAEAAFDWVFFADVEWNSNDRPQAVPVVGGFPVGTPSRVNQAVAYSTGVRKPLTSGGTFEVSQGQTYSDEKSSGINLVPDPSNSAFIDLRVDQPILRGFGSDVALAEVQLQRNAERRSVQELKSTLIGVATSAEQTYWRLVRARAALQIAQKNLDRGIETRQVVKAREQFDARPAEISDAVATVERRRSTVISAVNELRKASDELKALMNDEGLTVGAETLLDPADLPLDAPITFSLLDAVIEAIDHRPEVKQALLTIDDASIRQTVADNARLPQLNLAFQTRFQGLGTGADDAYEQVVESQFVDFIARADFEQPLGNRAAEAGYRQRQLERMRATVGYRRVVQQVVLEVKIALRDITTQYRLIEQTRASRLAAAENLRTLLVLERTVQSLTPDFLNLKFTRQDNLAQAELDELNAVVNYNIALASLHAATGRALERNAIKFEIPEVPADPSGR